MKHGRLAHVRSQFSLFRRSPTHKNLPPATFCTSERVFAVLFARRKKYQKPFPLQGVLRFCKPRISTQNNNFAQTKLKPISALVSLKHGRLAHVRSQFSLFRRSPTHKNLPLATFCTSEQKVCPYRDGTLRVLFLPLRGLFFGGHAAFLGCLRQPFSPPAAAIFGGKAAARVISPHRRNHSRTQC